MRVQSGVITNTLYNAIIALIFVILAHIVLLVAGDWNMILYRLEAGIKNKCLIFGSVLYSVSGIFLIIVSALFTDIIMKSYSSDTKYGPLNGNVVVQKQDQNLVRYEFGICLYLGYTFGFLEMIIGVAHIAFNPFKTEKDELMEKEEPEYQYTPDYTVY